MPFIDITVVEGRTDEQIRALIANVTEGAAQAFGASKDIVAVIVRQVPPTQMARADKTVAERIAESKAS
jgi:4-oxalocrotonate tautomerase